MKMPVKIIVAVLSFTIIGVACDKKKSGSSAKTPAVTCTWNSTLGRYANPAGEYCTPTANPNNPYCHNYSYVPNTFNNGQFGNLYNQNMPNGLGGSFVGPNNQPINCNPGVFNNSNFLPGYQQTFGTYQYAYQAYCSYLGQGYYPIQYNSQIICVTQAYLLQISGQYSSQYNSSYWANYYASLPQGYYPQLYGCPGGNCFGGGGSPCASLGAGYRSKNFYIGGSLGVCF